MEEITYRPLNLRWWLALGASFSVGAVSVSVPFFWGLSTGRIDERHIVAGLLLVPTFTAWTLFAFNRALSRTRLEAGGIRVLLPLWRRWYPWEEIVDVPVMDTEVFITLTDGSRVRLPAPTAASDSDPRFGRSVIEIRRRQREAAASGR